MSSIETGKKGYEFESKTKVRANFEKVSTIPSKFKRQTLKSIIEEQVHQVELLIPLNESESVFTTDLIDALRSKTLLNESEKGNIALVLIRPHAQNNSKMLSDEEMTHTIKEELKKVGLNHLYSFSLVFTKEMVEELAGHTKQRQETVPPSRYTEDFKNRWEEFVALMTTGPVTVVLFHSADGQAIPKVRSKIGHWDINKNPDETTLRGKYGLRDKTDGRSSNYTNLAHATDNPPHIKQEIEIIIKGLSRLISQKK